MPPQVVEAKTLYYNKVKFKTVPSETILHFYITRGGYLKPKDIAKVRELAKYIRYHPIPGLRHKDYEAFYDFSRRIREEFPIKTGFYKYGTILDYMLGGSITRNRIISKICWRFLS